MPARPSRTASLDTIARQLEGLQRHIDSLDQSMQRLAGRLVPYDDEANRLKPIHRPWVSRIVGLEDEHSPSLETVFEFVREADAHIEAMERDFAYVRSRIEDLERNDMLTDEIRPYLKPAKPR
jgi:prefoldin subunit 5